MPSPLFVVLVVASGQAEDPATVAVARSVEAAMAENTVVVVRETDEAHLDEPSAGRLGESLGAGAIVVLRWGQDHAAATIEVRTRDRVWVERELHFVAADPARERGRTAGFDVAAILARPEEAERPHAPASEPAVTTPPPATRAPGPRSSRAPRIAIDALGIGAAGAGATALGAELAARLDLAGGRLAPRLGVGGRFGDLSVADAHATVLRFAAGLAVALVPSTPARRWGFGVRSDAVLLWNRISRSPNASSDTLVVGGATGLIEMNVRLTRSFALVLGGGIEAAFGGVNVYVDQGVAETIRPVRAVVELGGRFGL